MDEITILVTPEQLSEKSGIVLTEVRTAKNAFANMQDAIRQSSGYWQGAAGDSHRQLFAKAEPDMEKLFTRFNETADNLRLIAANYLDTESQVKSETEVLASDVIV